MDGKLLPRKRRITRRSVLLVLGVLVLAAVGWYLLQRPGQFRLVTAIPQLPGGKSYWTPAGLVMEIPPGAHHVSAYFANRHATTITLTDWEGKARWSVTTPKATLPDPPGSHYSWNERTLTYSPDGRGVAVTLTDGPRVRVACWRDGKLRSDVRLPRLPGKPLVNPLYQTTLNDAGLVMVSTPALRTCHIWAFDGAHVAYGAHNSPFSPTGYNGTYRAEIPPDGSMLLWMTGLTPPPGPSKFQYVSLQLRGEKIIAKPRYTKNGSARCIGGGRIVNGGQFYSAGGRVPPSKAPRMQATLSSSMTYVYAPTWGNNIVRIALLRVIGPGTQKWIVPTSLTEGEGDATRNGRYVLLREYGVRRLPLPVVRTLTRFSFGYQFLKQQKSKMHLALYERPGRCRALLPLHEYGESYRARIGGDIYELRSWRLSPDGRHVGVKAYDPRKKQMVNLLLAW